MGRFREYQKQDAQARQRLDADELFYEHDTSKRRWRMDKKSVEQQKQGIFWGSLEWDCTEKDFRFKFWIPCWISSFTKALAGLISHFKETEWI